MNTANRVPGRTLVAATCCLALSAAVSSHAIDDWPQWRGPKRDGVSVEPGLLKSLRQAGPPLAWKAQGAGEGYSSFAAANERLYTLGARGGSEFALGFDPAPGRKI